MPIFGRRQLQMMLSDLGPWLTPSKTTDLIKRIEHRDPDQALPGEYELALAWAVSKVASLEVDRPLGRRSPDIYSEDLIAGGPVVADVAAISDDALSGESLMRRAANIINAASKRVIKDAPNHLHFQFQEESGYRAADRSSGGFQRYFRRRKIDRQFKMDDALEGALRIWLSKGVPKQPLRWTTQHIDVVVTWKDYVHPMGNTFSSMPSEAHDVRENPLYQVLKAKDRQLRGVEEGVRRAIFLGDAGCALLRNLRPIGGGIRTVSGHDVIRTFLADTTIDIVAVFVPKQASEFGYPAFENPCLWHLYVYDRRESVSSTDYDRVFALRDMLPAPSLHGYQARSWHQQGMFHPQGRGQYLPAKWTGGLGPMTVRISARGLQEFIAGRLSREEFERWITGERDIFGHHLSKGRTISSISLEPKGTAEDDDYVVFEFSDDPAAAVLVPPSVLKDTN